MDFRFLMTLIAALTGDTGDNFATLKAGGADPAASITQIACPRPLPAAEIEGTTAFCGSILVPENHAKPDGKKIPLKFMVLKSWSQYPEPDPLVYLQGGPGGSAFAITKKIAKVFEPWRKTRDIVFWDQRSAGLSGRSVKCYNALAANALRIAKNDFTTGDAANPEPETTTISECLKEVEAAGVEIANYNTRQNALDVRTITRALGYPEYNLYGISYGTKLALETMRAAPEGIRSVIIDGVAPPWVRLYDTLALKTSETIDHVVNQCKADATCNAAYPDLERIVIETLKMAKEGKILHQGKPVTVDTVLRPFGERNTHDENLSMTPYIPAFIYELHRGKEMPTVDMLVARNFVMPKPGDDDIAAAAAGLPKAERGLIATLTDNAAISDRIARSNDNVMAELRDLLDESGQFGPVAVLFDRELEKSLKAAKAEDPSRLEMILADYVALQNIAPSKEALAGFVKGHTAGEAQLRLLALIEGMNTAEVSGSFAIIRRDAAASEAGFFDSMYLYNYACQEDIPYNSYEGFKAYSAGLKYPYLGEEWDGMARMFFGACKPFKPQPRENWHEPVASDIPTLSIGGLYDSQTPASWAKVAVEKLTQAQVFLIPEAGHGAVLYQSCVADMGVAFVNNRSANCQTPASRASRSTGRSRTGQKPAAERPREPPCGACDEMGTGLLADGPMTQRCHAAWRKIICQDFLEGAVRAPLNAQGCAPAQRAPARGLVSGRPPDSSPDRLTPGFRRCGRPESRGVSRTSSSRHKRGFRC